LNQKLTKNNSKSTVGTKVKELNLHNWTPADFESNDSCKRIRIFTQ